MHRTSTCTHHHHCIFFQPVTTQLRIIRTALKHASFSANLLHQNTSAIYYGSRLPVAPLQLSDSRYQRGAVLRHREMCRPWMSVMSQQCSLHSSPLVLSRDVFIIELPFATCQLSLAMLFVARDKGQNTSLWSSVLLALSTSNVARGQPLISTSSSQPATCSCDKYGCNSQYARTLQRQVMGACKLIHD